MNNTEAILTAALCLDRAGAILERVAMMKKHEDKLSHMSHHADAADDLMAEARKYVDAAVGLRGIEAQR